MMNPKKVKNVYLIERTSFSLDDRCFPFLVPGDKAVTEGPGLAAHTCPQEGLAPGCGPSGATAGPAITLGALEENAEKRGWWGEGSRDRPTARMPWFQTAIAQCTLRGCQNFPPWRQM